jgi:molybdate transport system substrate-binding protein
MLWFAWLLAVSTASASAAEIDVLSAGAIEPGLKPAVAAFEKATGHTVRVTFNTAPQIRQRLAQRGPFAVVIAPRVLLDELTASGQAGPARTDVGGVGLGVAVRPGAPVPDIASADALKRSVLEADSLVYNRASTGLYFESLLAKLGIAEQVAARTTRYADGASVMAHVLKGTGREIGVGPITEILLVRDQGLRLVGPLPPEVQNVTRYQAATLVGAAEPLAAALFVQFLEEPAARALFEAAGIAR